MGVGPVLIHWDHWRVEYWRKTNVLGELGQADTRGPGLLQPLKVITALPKDGVALRGSTMPSPGTGDMLIHPSASWQGLTPLWSTGAPTRCVLGFRALLIQPHMQWRCLQRVEKENQYHQQALQPFLPLFLPPLPSGLASLPSPDGHSCFRLVAEASGGVCMAWGKEQVLPGEGTSTDLILLCCSGQGSKAPRDKAGNWDQHRDVNSCTGMPGSLFYLGYPKGIPHSLSASVPAHSSLGESRDRH